jgi:prepilin peptidase CpaA
MLAVAVLATALAAAWDWRTGRIPNWLTGPAILIGLLGQGLIAGIHAKSFWAGLEGSGLAVLGGLVCAVVPLAMFCTNAMGGGDVKLFVAIGTLCLSMRGLTAQTYSFAFALAVVAVWLSVRGTLIQTIRDSLRLLRRPFGVAATPKQERAGSDALTSFRLGPAIFAGTLAMALLESVSA